MTSTKTFLSMMLFGLGLVAAAVAAAQGVSVDKGNKFGYAQVVNECDFALAIYSVGQWQRGPFYLDTGSTWAEQMWRDPVAGGIAIKVLRKSNSPNALGGAHTVFAYNANQPEGNLNYDLTNMFGPDVFAGHAMEMRGGPGCPVVYWSDGHATARAGRACQGGVTSNLTLTVCKGGY
ncbi:hypothetical protein CDD81_7577 [Ophiocordyceps australis]|uniref:Uncharacterized protein n=1 Tax=Ophiocordyceps australis TaxID=1399860 RepID=A0A2C5Y544_9HYPO|nr:hypothetical protein CDD81_7577 [Ophiocordyceps australis]